MLPKQANTKRFVSLTISLSLADSSYHFFSIQKSDPKCFSVFIENISKEISFQPQTSYTSKKNVIHENLRYRHPNFICNENCVGNLLFYFQEDEKKIRSIWSQNIILISRFQLFIYKSKSWIQHGSYLYSPNKTKHFSNTRKCKFDGFFFLHKFIFCFYCFQIINFSSNFQIDCVYLRVCVYFFIFF